MRHLTKGWRKGFNEFWWVVSAKLTFENLFEDHFSSKLRCRRAVDNEFLIRPSTQKFWPSHLWVRFLSRVTNNYACTLWTSNKTRTRLRVRIWSSLIWAKSHRSEQLFSFSELHTPSRSNTIKVPASHSCFPFLEIFTIFLSLIAFLWCLACIYNLRICSFEMQIKKYQETEIEWSGL